VKKKDRLLFLLKLVLLTLILGYLWYIYIQRSYPTLLEPIAEPVFRLTGVRRWWLVLLLEHFTSLVPYAALILATIKPIKEWRRSLTALVGGIAIIVVGHLLMSIATYYIMENFAATRTSYVLLVPVYLINDALPLALWLLFYGSFFTCLIGRHRPETVAVDPP